MQQIRKAKIALFLAIFVMGSVIPSIVQAATTQSGQASCISFDSAKLNSPNRTISRAERVKLFNAVNPIYQSILAPQSAWDLAINRYPEAQYEAVALYPVLITIIDQFNLPVTLRTPIAEFIGTQAVFPVDNRDKSTLFSRAVLDQIAQVYCGVHAPAVFVQYTPSLRYVNMYQQGGLLRANWYYSGTPTDNTVDITLVETATGARTLLGSMPARSGSEYEMNFTIPATMPVGAYTLEVACAGCANTTVVKAQILATPAKSCVNIPRDIPLIIPSKERNLYYSATTQLRKGLMSLTESSFYYGTTHPDAAGFFGNQTKSAVKRFQVAHNLANQTGSVDLETRNLIRTLTCN